MEILWALFQFQRSEMKADIWLLGSLSVLVHFKTQQWSRRDLCTPRSSHAFSASEGCFEAVFALVNSLHRAEYPHVQYSLPSNLTHWLKAVSIYG